MSKWSLHQCAFGECYRDRSSFDPDRLWRMHLNTPWFHLGVALHPNSRFAYVPPRRSRWTTHTRYRNGEGSP